MDAIDEYGYTPLIQTAIINSLPKARLLLRAGASIDFPDLTGRTALFWAADNGNLDLCQLYLDHRANPDVYHRGGQPALAMPYLKKHYEIKRLLVSRGAHLSFAQDFLDAKLLGHSFELEGRVDIVSPRGTFIELELEGFYLRFILEFIKNSLIDFKSNFAARRLSHYFHSFDIIIKQLQIAIELISMQNYLLDVETVADRIGALINEEILILPIAFDSHAIVFIKMGDTIIRCDRGEFGRVHGPVIYYHLGRPANFTQSLVKALLYKRQHTEFINDYLIKHLALTSKKILGLSFQKTGNCSWANVEAVIPAIIFELLSINYIKSDSCDPGSIAINLYYEWQEWTRDRLLNLTIQKMPDEEGPRQVSKAALLAVVLFQSCSNGSWKERLRANKILSVLTKPRYMHILKCYVRIFSQNSSAPLWKNFCNLLTEYGLDVDRLRATTDFFNQQ